MMRLLLTIIKTDFQHDYNTGLDEAGVFCFWIKYNINKHYNDNNANNRSVVFNNNEDDNKNFNNVDREKFDYRFSNILKRIIM